MHVPLDWLFGTYAGCKEEVIFCPLSTISIFSLSHYFHLVMFTFSFINFVSTMSTFKVSKIWHGQKSGEEANETAVHAASAKAGKVE